MHNLCLEEYNACTVYIIIIILYVYTCDITWIICSLCCVLYMSVAGERCYVNVSAIEIKCDIV